MGYLADIVADARDRHSAEVDPAYFEQAVELTVPGESGEPAVRMGAAKATPHSPVTSENAAAVNRAESKHVDSQPARNEITASKPVKDIPEPVPRPIAAPSLHEQLLRLSQKTLVERSEEILSRQQNSDAPSTINAGDIPVPAQQPTSPSGGHKRESNSPAEIITDGSLDSSDNSPVQHVCDTPSPHHISVRYTEIREEQGQATRMLPDDRAQLHRHFDSQAAKNSGTERPLPPMISATAQTEREAAMPSRQYRDPSHSAPQLRIEQINVVVESTRPYKEHRSGLERDSDPGSRYFLRSL